MWLEIVHRGVEVNDAAKERIERRLSFALGRFGDRVGRVSVQLADANGPRGGVDKQCRVVVDLPGLPQGSAVVEDVAADLNTVIDRASDRIGQVVRRRLERARMFAPAGGRRSEPDSDEEAEPVEAGACWAGLNATWQDAEVHRLKHLIHTRLGGRIRDFSVLIANDGLILRGQAATTYVKQVVREEVAAASLYPIARDEIEVNWFSSEEPLRRRAWDRLFRSSAAE